MVDVHVREDSLHRLSSFFASGHAGWADSGEDVVCAAVSTLLQSVWLGLSEYAKIDVRGVRESGKLVLQWPKESREDPDVRAIVTTAVLSIEQIATQYPEQVRVVREREPKD